MLSNWPYGVCLPEDLSCDGTQVQPQEVQWTTSIPAKSTVNCGYVMTGCSGFP